MQTISARRSQHRVRPGGRGLVSATDRAGGPVPARLDAHTDDRTILRLAIEASEAGTCDVDLATGMCNASDRLLEIFGFSQQQIRMEHWIARIHPQDRRMLQRAFEQAVRKSGECAAEFRVVHPQRTRRIRAVATVLRDAEGAPARVIGVAVDLSTVRMAGDGSGATEDRLRRLVSQAPIPAILHAENGRILAISRGCTEATGYGLRHVRTMGGWSERVLGVANFIEGDCKVRTAAGRIRIWSLKSVPAGHDSGGRKLFAVLATDLTEQCRAQVEARRAQQELQALTARLISAQEEERARVSRELHDDIGQRLAAMKLRIGRLIRGNRVFLSDVAENLTWLEQQFAALATDCRRIARGLHPAVLEEAGLEVALRDLCSGFEQGFPFTASFSNSGPAVRIRSDVQLALYRVAQESLHNASRHSRASHVCVSLHRKRRRLELTVRDDGIGFRVNSSAARGGLGIVSMRERMRAVGGDLAIETQQGLGTAVRASVPLRGGKHAAASHPDRRRS